MTPNEAAIVAAVIAETDAGCLACVARATCALDKDLPWVAWYDLVAEASDGAWTAEQLRAEAPCQRAG